MSDIDPDPKMTRQSKGLDSTSSSDSATTLDDIIHASSVWQRPVILLMFRGIPSAFFILGITFLAPKGQDFFCSRQFNMNDTTWRDHNKDINGHCYYHPENNTGQNITLECSSWTYDRTDYFWTVKEEFNWVCNNDRKPLEESILMVGMMLGNFVFSHVSDWYGRKISILGSVLCSFIGGLAMALSPNFVIFTILRIIMAMGLGGGQNGPITLAMEVVNPSNRAVIAYCDAFGWIIGILLLPIFPYFIRHWRWLQFVLSFGNIPMLIMAIITYESPKWLLATGQKERARPIVRQMLRANGMTDCDEKVEEVLNNTVVHKPNENKVSIALLFQDRHTAFTTISFIIQYPISILVYYNMMFFIVDIDNNPYINTLITGAFEVPCLILVFIFVKVLRRKVLYVLLYIPSILATAGLYFTTGKWPQMAVATIGKMGVQLGFSVMGVHVNETYPTRMRGIALGIFITMSRFGAISSPFVKPTSMLFQCALNSGTCLLGLLFSLPLRETFNKPLPDDDEDGQVSVVETDASTRYGDRHDSHSMSHHEDDS